MEPFAIVLGVIACTQTFHNIIDTIRRACQFKEECVELGAMVALLLVITETNNITDNNQSADSLNQPPARENMDLASQNAIAKVEETSRDIHKLVVKCTERFLQRGWEVLVKRKIERLKQQLFEWITVCMMENTVSRSFKGSRAWSPELTTGKCEDGE
jgi:hypothetical protein